LIGGVKEGNVQAVCVSSARRVHLTAIGGTGMGALAGLLAESGCEVRGSDRTAIYPPMSDQLAALGIPAAIGFAEENLDWGPDLLVLGNTCRADNLEYLAALSRGLPVRSFPQLLGERFLAGRWPIVVAGTHGKTTTSSLAAHVLAHAGRDPGYLIGGVPLNFGRSFAAGAPPFFVVEGDEYDSACFDKQPKFMHYRPRSAILTGVEFDHADIFADLEAVERAFAHFIDLLPADGHLIVGADSPVALRLAEEAACPVTRYRALPADAGVPAGAPQWVGRYAPLGRGRQHLVITHPDGELPPMELPLTGAHNMSNCVAVAAVATAVGLDPDEIAAGLQSFAGVKRRQELRGIVGGVAVVEDFAHHPTAVQQTLAGLRGAYGEGRLIAVFEPRSSTSKRKVFQREFAEALATADQGLVAPIFEPAKVPAGELLDLPALVAAVERRGAAARAPGSVDAIIEHLVRNCRAGDTVVIMSSGGFEGLPTRLVEALHGRKDPR
jgi:UDP-N-acetylmuramate: L-alanyl-gamma-D-glutamyl-meso-diaminopimelate ligase